MNTFAERMKFARKAKGLTQKELAKRVGVSQATVADIERGRNQGSTEIASFAKVLGVTPNWLAYGIEDFIEGQFSVVDEAAKSTIRKLPSYKEADPIEADLAILGRAEAASFIAQIEDYETRIRRVRAEIMAAAERVRQQERMKDELGKENLAQTSGTAHPDLDLSRSVGGRNK